MNLLKLCVIKEPNACSITNKVAFIELAELHLQERKKGVANQKVTPDRYFDGHQRSGSYGVQEPKSARQRWPGMGITFWITILGDNFDEEANCSSMRIRIGICR